MIKGSFTTLQALAVAALAVLFVSALLYLPFSSYYDHCEAAVASLSLVLFQGDQPLYHGADAAARYALSYGPMLYLLVGLPSYISGATIAATKLSGILACALALFLLFKLIRRHCQPPLALILIGLYVLCLLLFENYSYWNRPDPFLVLCVVIGLSTASASPIRLAALCVGVATGIAVNLKIHGAIYMLPVIALLLMRRPGWPGVIIAITSATAALAAPFLLTQISLVDYLLSLTVAPRHGLSPSQLLENITYLALILTPMIGFVLMGPRHALSPHVKILAGTMAAVLLIITVISSKRGAGAHHYLPALPSLIYFCSLMLGGLGKEDLLARIRDRRPVRAGFLLLATSWVVIAFMAAQSQGRIMELLASDGEYRDASHELRRILTDYSGSSIQMGYTDRSNYRLTHLRPLVVAGGNPYWFDAVALMDYDAADIVMPQSTLRALKDCATEIWILPATGAPFLLKNYYATGRNIFGDEFGRVFSENYAIIRSTAHYAVWKCRSAPG